MLVNCDTGVDSVDESFLIRFLPWRQKDRSNTKSAQIKFAPQLRIIRENDWVYLNLVLLNRSSWPVWVKEATVVLTHLDAVWQTAVPTCGAKYEILQNVDPKDSLSVSLARTIYDAAGRPQGPYSCFVSTSVFYSVFDEWCTAKLETYRVEMAALTVVGLHRTRRYNKRIKSDFIV